MLTITVKDGDRFYRVTVTPKWAERHNNFALVSYGLTVGLDLSPRAWAMARKRFMATEITNDEYQHSSCQSRCVRRGDSECRW